MMNKKGAMTTEQIIAIALGVVVLLMLILALTGVFNPLTYITSGLTGGKVNIDSTKIICTAQCQQKNQQGFCSEKRNVVIEGGYKGSYTCAELQEVKELPFTKSTGTFECKVSAVDGKKIVVWETKDAKSVEMDIDKGVCKDVFVDTCTEISCIA